MFPIWVQPYLSAVCSISFCALGERVGDHDPIARKRRLPGEPALSLPKKPLPIVRNFREKLSYPMRTRDIRSSFYQIAKMTTERFAAIGPFSGKLELSGVRKTGKLELFTFPKTGELQLHI
jgi:hypothetical protein